MHFESIFIYMILIILGLMSGSFAGASVWRLRAGQLKTDKAEGEKINESESESLKHLSNQSLLKDRSKCLN